MRQSWTDDRLDDLSNRMDARFDHVEMEMKDNFERVDKDLRELRGAMGALQRTSIQVGGGLIVAVVGLTITQL